MYNMENGNSSMSSLGGLLTGSVNFSDMSLTTLVFIVATVVIVLVIAICKFNLIPDLDKKIPFLQNFCTKKEVCFAGETCDVSYEQPDIDQEQPML